jgi:hypothetical protein
VGTRKWLGVHWRFDEGFCRYPKDNAVGIKSNVATATSRRSRSLVDVCFHSWFYGGKTTWTKKEEIVTHIVEIAKSGDYKVVYLSTDNMSDVFWKFLKESFATTGIELLPPVHEMAKKLTSNLQFNYQRSLLEQELCIAANYFIGTVSSTWSEQVCVCACMYVRVCARVMMRAEVSSPSHATHPTKVTSQRWLQGKQYTWLADFSRLPGPPNAGLGFL